MYNVNVIYIYIYMGVLHTNDVVCKPLHRIYTDVIDFQAGYRYTIAEVAWKLSLMLLTLWRVIAIQLLLELGRHDTLCVGAIADF